jgi:iron complex transport system substrate-binding protein
MRLFFSILTLFILNACHQNTSIKATDKDIYPKYANHFNVKIYKDSTVLQVINPYQNAKQTSFRYCLSSHKIKNSITIPIKKVIILSTTHIGFLSALDKELCISGISGTNLVYNPNVLNQIKAGHIKEIGYENSLNYEQLLSLKPDVVFAYAVNEESLPYIKKITDLGIPVVYVAEYLENNPLGRAEWIKFFAAFFNELPKADSIFNQVEREYNTISDKAATYSNKPSVLLNLPLNDIWYLPGKSSFTAKIIHDAGGNYIFCNDSSAEILRYDKESVFSKASGCDFWINTGMCSKIDDILLTDKRYSVFHALKKGNVYNQTLKTTADGGNDFWESGVVYPQYILDDLFHIFHLQNDTSYRFHLYTKLKQ